MKKIVIVDYGYGNLHSLSKAMVYLGAEATISSDPRDILSADALILPGVGAFGDGMAELIKRGLKEPILQACASGKPILGICLGMQFLFDRSFEFGEHQGLGILKGSVNKIEVDEKESAKIPHMGWNSLRLPEGRMDWKGTALDGIANGSEVYFVHSYVGYPEDLSDIIADTYYGGRSFASVVARGKVTGVQFHPEKSGETGIAILKNFLSL